MKKIVMLLFVSLLFITSGCASIEQQKTLGANDRLDEGFRVLGIKGARSLEGPLSDMLVPDDVPKSRTLSNIMYE